MKTKLGMALMATVTAMSLGALPSRAQAPAQAALPAPRPPIELHALTSKIYWTTDSSNIGVIIGDKGVAVFDTGGSLARGKELVAAIAKVTPKPVDTVILSHVDGDHVGGLEAFPAGIKIIAHPYTRDFLKTEAAAGRGPVQADHVPNQTMSGGETLILEGVKVQFLNWGPAHTGGDLVLYMPDDKIVFAGDIFCLNIPRAFVHPAEKGSADGWAASAQGVLKLDADRILVGHGGVETKATLRKFADATLTERAQVKTLVGQGKPLPVILAEVNEPPHKSGSGAVMEPYAQVLYEELKPGQ